MLRRVSWSVHIVEYRPDKHVEQSRDSGSHEASFWEHLTSHLTASLSKRLMELFTENPYQEFSLTLSCNSSKGERRPLSPISDGCWYKRSEKPLCIHRMRSIMFKECITHTSESHYESLPEWLAESLVESLAVGMNARQNQRDSHIVRQRWFSKFVHV